MLKTLSIVNNSVPQVESGHFIQRLMESEEMILQRNVLRVSSGINDISYISSKIPVKPSRSYRPLQRDTFS